jgi:tRNA(Ile)-lysidine synthase
MPGDLNLNTTFAELDDLKARYGQRFIVGLSGGGDSMALAHICARWAKLRGADVSALCIDHGFRPEAADEARQARAWARALGLCAQIVTNTVPTPLTGLQEFARSLRQKAFARAAYQAEGAVVLVGHTRDDQAETIAFRLARQTGLDGLAGMARVTPDLLTWEGQYFPLARPLLSIRRSALRDYLKQEAQTWVDDPSNGNTDFSRVKIRKRLAQLGQHDRLIAIGDHARALRRKVEATGQRLLANASLSQSVGATALILDASTFLQGPACAQKWVLAQQIYTLSPRQRPLDSGKIERLCIRIAQGDFARSTLAGVMITKTKGRLHFAPAPLRKSPKQPIG